MASSIINEFCGSEASSLNPTNTHQEDHSSSDSIDGNDNSKEVQVDKKKRLKTSFRKHDILLQTTQR